VAWNKVRLASPPGSIPGGSHKATAANHRAARHRPGRRRPRRRPAAPRGSAQVLAGFGVDPADEGVRRDRKNQSPDGTLALGLAHSRTPRPGRASRDRPGRYPARVAGHLVTTPDTGAAARGAADTHGQRLPERHYPGLGRARPRPDRLPQRERDLRRTAALSRTCAARSLHMTSACSTRPRQRVCPSTRPADSNRLRDDTGRGAPWPCVVPSTGSIQDIGRPTASPDAGPPWSTLSRDPMTSQVTTAPGNGSRRQTPSDGPITLVSADPTRCDLAGRTYSLCNGDRQRPNPGVPPVPSDDARRFRLTPSH
jgi:hypothetical protein